ncbi:MAG: AbrB/MazE/SpoVT family DNA-binding domain-containing protein [Candidatus Lokiarchaeota archaeon]|nr:AbrB/MazE/SpoVT family DNA-binding domain-containing protein [Candidatus Lokiarchaeota archaeon]
METRKVQITGGSSYIVTLPKGWIEKNGIEAKDAVGIIEQRDGTILITPKDFKKQTYREKEFSLNGIQDPKYLFRLLIGAYMMGYSVLYLKSNRKIEPKFRNSIQKFVQAAIGFEIMEEDTNNLKLKDLMSPTEMPFANMLDRLYLLVKNMHQDALTALSTKNKDLANDIISRDDEVDKLYWLVARHSNIVLRNLIISKKSGVDPEEANFYYFISRIIERVGDHAVNIAKNIPKIITSKLDEKIIKKIKEAGLKASNIFEQSIAIWNKGDKVKAHETIESIGSLDILCDEINSIAVNIEGEVAIAIGYIVESIRRTGDYSINICEMTINHLVAQE